MPRFKSLFPTIIAQGALPGATALNRRLLVDIESLRRQDKLGLQWSKENYIGGYTSYGSLTDLHYRTPAFTRFAELLDKEVLAFARAQSWQMHGVKLVMTACWMNIMPRHVHHTLHLHPHSVISGAYYVATPAQSVALKIEDPRMAFYMNAPLRSEKAGLENQLYYQVKPQAGNFVLFESWLRHEVPPNQSATPRISLSFNYSLEEV